MASADVAAQRPPVLLTVDDDPQVLDALTEDLTARYGGSYRVRAAPSGEQALAFARQLGLRGEELALVVCDQRMPGMTGTEVLAEAKRVHPGFKSVLLTAYADTEAAITAINDVGLDHYVMKPWDPPEERLFPILDDLLEEWAATRQPPVMGTRVIGERWSAACHGLRDFLARNLVRFEWIDVENRAVADPLRSALPDDVTLPVVLLEDGDHLANPDRAVLARRLGLGDRPQVDVVHDLVVVGAGPAGLAAAVYGSSEGLRTVVVEAEAPGGQAGLSSLIENYLGFPEGIRGDELAGAAHEQASKFETEIMLPYRAVGLRRQDPYRVVTLDDGRELYCSAVILATGVQYRRLEADGLDHLTGAGVYYGAASTEAEAMSGQRVVVVGGANSAGQAALHLARYAAEVVIAVRAPELSERMSSYLVDRVKDTANIVVRTSTRVVAACGERRLDTVRLATDDGVEDEIEAAGMFIFIGAEPGTEWLHGDVVCDEHGFVVTGTTLQQQDRWSLPRAPHLLETSIPAVFAVGDIRASSVKRIASAVGEGSIAVQFVHEVLRSG